MLSQINSEILDRYFNNQTTDSENLVVQKWLLNRDNDTEIKIYLNNFWEKMDISNESAIFDKEHMLDKIHHTINIKPGTNNVKKSGKRSINMFWYKVAAIIMLPLLIFNVAYFGIKSFKAKELSWQTIEVSPGTKSKFTLPDGTLVWINSNSRISFPIQFIGNERLVKLSGEAYFEVASNKNKPFKVRAANAEIVALGTKFNIKAYSDENILYATLIEGKISVEAYCNNNNSKLKILSPNETARVQKNLDNIEVEETESKVALAWLNNKLVFKNSKLVDILPRLSRWYNAEFVIADKEIEDLTYTITLKDETLIQMINLLKIATPIDYVIEKESNINKNEFEKVKVILKKRK